MNGEEQKELGFKGLIDYPKPAVPAVYSNIGGSGKMRMALLLFGILLLGAVAYPVVGSKGAVHPVICYTETGDSTGSYVIGGTVDGKWAKPKQVSMLMTGKEKYKIYSEAGNMREAVGTAPRYDKQMEGYEVSLSPWIKEYIIGISGN